VVLVLVLRPGAPFHLASTSLWGGQRGPGGASIRRRGGQRERGVHLLVLDGQREPGGAL